MSSVGVVSPEEVSQMSQLLLGLTQPNTETIRQAEAALKPILKVPQSVAALLEILKQRETHPPAVRHVAAILLRKRIGSHYTKHFDPATQIAFRSELLQILSSEPIRSVRGGVVGVTAVVVKLSFEESNSHRDWPELWQFIAAASNDANEDARELAFWLLQDMTDTIGVHLKPQFPNMAQSLFPNALQNTSPHKVQKMAVKALGQLMSFVSNEPEIDIFSPLLPAVLTVTYQSLQSGDEDTVSTVLDVLYDLSFSPSLSPDQLRDMVKLASACLSHSSLELGVRDSAALVIATLAEAKPKSFGKETEMLHAVLDLLFRMIEESPESAAGALLQSNPAWKEDLGLGGDDDEDDGPTGTSMAQGTLDMLACELPKKYIFEPVMQRCVAKLGSTHPAARKAGIAGLGVVAEGCAEPLKEHLPQIMPLVFQTARDGDAQVRECSCFCLGQISEHCQPEILQYADQILPIVFHLLDDQTVSVQATSCYVLEMFCERLEPDAVRPLLDSLVRKLVGMLETTNKRSVQEMVVAALAATAVAAEEEFQPYMTGVAEMMLKLMALEEERLFNLRGRALECMGHMAIAVGKDTFRPYFQGTMQCAMQGLLTESTDLHEFAYANFANLAKVMGEEFAPALPEIIPHLVRVLESNEGTMEKSEGTDNEAFASLDDSDDEDDEEGYVLHVRTALLDAKKGAITAIGEMAANTGAAFVPHLEVVTKALSENGVKHWHPLIKAESAEVLSSLVIPMVALADGGEVSWTKGDVTGPNPMSPKTHELATAVLMQLFILMKEDDKDTVGKACEGIQSVVELVGPHVLAPVATECLGNIHELLMRKAPCQLVDEGFEDAYEDDDDDHDSFMTSVCDLLGGIARVMGNQIQPILKDFLPVICEYCRSSRPSSDRSMGVGLLSELAQELDGPSYAEYWNSFFQPVILAGLADPDDNVKRNASFCAGVCCESLGETIKEDYPKLLQGLSTVFAIDPSKDATAAAAVDNAVAGVSRMIMAYHSGVPLGQVLPTVLKALPLKNDMTENETVYKCLLGLIQLNQPDLVANSQEVKRILVEATSENSKVADEIKEKLRAALQGMS